MSRLLKNDPTGGRTRFFSRWVLFTRILGMSKKIIRNLWNVFRNSSRITRGVVIGRIVEID